ncbi:vWA domain-containing protein [Nocardia lijiangensis]|uniref:vWA domain-containing protein n=1 Tax=Nocardia lijiangensis TaxID=299618 RepID=UPI003D7484A3
MVRAHRAFAYLPGRLYELDPRQTPPEVWARIVGAGVAYHPKRRAESAEWAWVFAHCLLHAGFGHLDPRGVDPANIVTEIDLSESWSIDKAEPHPAYRAACCAVVDQYLATMKIGRRPIEFPGTPSLSDEHAAAARWRDSAVPAEYRRDDPPDFLISGAAAAERADDPGRFATGIAAAARDALTVAGGEPTPEGRRPQRAWDAALSWFVSSYPLLGALAAGMTLVADADLARGWDIAIAAVNAEAAEIYVNPLAGLTQQEWRFVLAHEMLHAALRHGERTAWRDPYLFNIACDYVVNGWLVELGVGVMPEGLLYDPELKGCSAEEVYDRIAVDLRRLRKLATLRGRGRGDVLGEPLPHSGGVGRFVDLDEYYRNALSTGLAYHLNSGRGYVPAALEQAIRAMDQPPLPWDAQLAHWFDEHDIPRPAWVRPEEATRLPTFGVVLDTSGSMDAALLGKGLGAIASYALARDVPRARVVYCDAAAYDAGYLPVEEIARGVRVRGRGGTVLQPGVRLLERADDFPAGGPILIITDGACDVLRVRHEHAYLIPAGSSLPFRPYGPVFRMR